MPKKILTLSDVTPKGAENPFANTRRVRRGRTASCNRELLARCNQAWEKLRNVRETYERVKDYCYGDQWGDLIESKNGIITERQYLKQHNTIPLVNNIMVSILGSVVGLYAKQGTEPLCFARTRDAQQLSDMMSATLQSNWQQTKQADLLKHACEDYLLSGVMVGRETYEERDQIYDAWTDTINVNYAFWEGGYDPRQTTLQLIGVLHDISPEDLFYRFAREEYGLTRKEISRIFDLPENGSTVNGDSPFGYSDSNGLQQNEQHALGNISFSTPSDLRNRRVIEVWYKKSTRRLQCYDPLAHSQEQAYFRRELGDTNDLLRTNRERKRMYEDAGVPEKERAYIRTWEIEDSYWQYCFMAPDGTVLCEGESPYDFHSHPFTLKLYPFINGEIHPYMGNIIDQQRYINRLIVMHDMAARSAAKGVTIVPRSALGNLTPQEFAEQWTAYDGLIFYDPDPKFPNLRPEVITSSAVQIGTYELLQMQLNLIRDISNVSGALQGKTPSAGTSAARYSQETQNATTSLYTILHDMTSFTESVAEKKVEVIKQFYEDGRLVYNKDNTGQLEYDALSARDVMFKISVKEAGATAAYQAEVNEYAGKLLEMGLINIKQYLQSVNLPFGDSLLQQIETEEARQQAIMEMQQQLEGQPVNQQAVQQAQQMLQSS
jgi:hypothetical protein